MISAAVRLCRPRLHRRERSSACERRLV